MAVTYAKLRGVLDKLMYLDTVAVYRLSQTKSDDGFDDYTESETAVLQDIPCKLSQYGKDMLMSKTAESATVQIDLRLCCAPDVDIRENDHLVVTHQGQTFNLYAGTRFAYPTHQAISVRRTREARQDGT